MDTKNSGILGACLIIAALIVTLVPRPQAAAPVPSSAQVGRYQMGGVPGRAYVIDTTTGQVWENSVVPTQVIIDQDFKKPKPRQVK